MKQELKLKLKKFLKIAAKWIAIIVGVIIAARVVKNVLDPRKNETVEDAKDTIEKLKVEVDNLEVQKDEIEEEHQEILVNKKERDEKAKKYFGDL